jgi:hypothetical protein
MDVSEETAAALAAKLSVMLPHLDERQRRLLIGAEASALPPGTTNPPSATTPPS